MPPSRKTTSGQGRHTQFRNTVSRPQPNRTREERPNRESRRSSSLHLSSRDHRIPMDCPLPVCNARTVHQHFGQPQYFNPHPGNEIRYPGYASSHRLTSSQSNEANKVPAMRGQDAPEAEDFEEEAAQEQDGNGQTPIASGDEKDDQEEATDQRTLIIAPEVAASAMKNDTQKSYALASSPKEQQDVEILHGTTLEQPIMMDDGIHDLTPGDPITSRRTLDFVEDLLTPLQTIPMANAGNAKAVQQQAEEPLFTTSSGLQDEFDEVLAPMTPEQAAELWDCSQK